MYNEEKALTNFVSAFLFYLLWTSLGLNQGPTDYESVIIKFFKILQNFHITYNLLFYNNFVSLQTKNRIL